MDTNRSILDVTRTIVITFLVASLCGTDAHAQEHVRIPSFDGEVIEGRLHLPPTGVRPTIVIAVPSSGPHTYVDRRRVGSRTVFQYHDYFADEFVERGIGYFSYSTRYTRPDSTPPYYDSVDKEKFLSYTPSTEVKDLEEVITFLKRDTRLVSSKVILLGWSSGTIIASLVAERQIVPIDALFLAGTPSDDVYATILWQHSGESSMITFRKFLDGNRDGVIQRSEYDGGDPRAIARVGGHGFDQLDLNHDSVLTTEDFRILAQPRLQEVLSAIDRDDDDWIWDSYFRVGTQWIKEHRSLEANKTRILRLDIPVYIFHGENDANAPVEGVLEMQRTAQEQGRPNVHFFVFADHDHSLEFLSWVVRRTIPDGLKTLFDEAQKF